MTEGSDAPRFLERLLGVLPWALAIVVLAGITHIVSILIMPRVAPRDSFARVAEIAPLGRVTLVDGESDALAAPFEDPALARGVCRYDLRDGAIRLRGALAPESLMLFSFHSRFGDVYYSMTDRSATRGRLNVLVLTRAQLDAVEEGDNEDELPSELRIVSPTREGFVLMRALAEYPYEKEDARRRVASIGCGLEKVAGN